MHPLAKNHSSSSQAPRRHRLRLPGLAVALLCNQLSGGQNAGSLSWPQPQLGSDARLSSLGDNININGLPALIYRFTTTHDAQEIVGNFRSGIERDFIIAPNSDALPGETTLGGRRGNFWITLQLKREAGLTTGTWAATPRFVPNAAHAVRRPPGFPASATLFQQIDSYDDDKRSEMAVGVDPAPVDAAAARLESELRGEGFSKESMPRQNWPSPSEYVAGFRKAREEVMVSLRQTAGGTSVVINRVSALEVLK